MSATDFLACTQVASPEPAAPAAAAPVAQVARAKSDSLLSAMLDPAGRNWSAVLALLLLCGALFFHGLNLGELYRTESLRAIIGAEFLRSGNWVVPVLYGQPLLTKPPGMYAAIAAASTLQGEVTEWTARLPSALAATALVLLIYWYVARQAGRRAGLVAAAIMPCTFLWLDKACAAEIDMLQVAWVGAALLFFFRAVEDDAGTRRHGQAAMEVDAETRRGGDAGKGVDVAIAASPRRRVPASLFWLLSLLCVAGGVLTKWTAPVFFYAAVIPFLLWRRQLGLLFSWQHLLGAAIGAAVCLAWVGAVIQQVGWDVFYETVRAEALPRISPAHHVGNHQSVAQPVAQVGETLLHPLKLLAVNLPWSGFALLTLVPGFLSLWDERGKRLVQAFHCWTWPNLIVWSLLPDHATRHAFPLFPGITGLGAMTWIAFLTGRLPERLARVHVGLAVLSLLVFGVAAVGGGLAGLACLPAGVWWLVLFVVVAGLWCVREGFRARREARWGGLLTSMILTWVVLKLAVLHLTNPVRDGVIALHRPETPVLKSIVKLKERAPRSPKARAAWLARAVPRGQTLHVTRWYKDEGIAFYYGWPVVRLATWHSLPVGREPVYALLAPWECKELQERSDWDPTLKLQLKDQQGDPLVLVAVTRSASPIRHAAAGR